MIQDLSTKNYRIELSYDDYEHHVDRLDRRLYLTVPIDNDELDCGMSIATALADDIIAYNRVDLGLPIEERKPIRLYINSPGGDIVDGFAIVGAIESSNTPVYTINIGQCSSMAFFICIAGHIRYALPYSRFLMHDGSIMNYGSLKKVQDQVKFEERFEHEVIREHVLSHSNMDAKVYDSFVRKELFMLPYEAQEYGFIDYIVDDLDAIV